MSKTARRLWAALWVALATISAIAPSWAGSGVGAPVSRGNFLRVPQYETTAALTLYVDPTGSDSNACTASGASACLTLQAAVNKIPKLVRHPVTVNVASGNYTGLSIFGYRFDPLVTANGAYINFIGTMTTATVATGTATGTATAGTAGSGTTFGTLTDSGQSWTTNDLIGKLLVITGGTGAGQQKIIDSNTATSITVAGTWTAPTGSSTYVIQNWGSVVDGNILRPAIPAIAASTGQTLYMEDNGHVRELGGSSAGSTQASAPITFTTMQFSPTTVTLNAARINGPNSVAFSRCRLAGKTTGAALVPLYNAAVWVGDSYLTSETNLVVSSGFNNAANSLLTFSASRLENGGGAGGAGVLGGPGAWNFSGTSFKTQSGYCISGGLGSAGPAPSNIFITSSRCVCANSGGSGIYLSSLTGAFTSAYINGLTIDNCGTSDAAVLVKGRGAHLYLNSADNVFTGLTNATGISVFYGASVYIGTDPTLTSFTYDLKVEGAATTPYSTFTALSPAAIMDLNYGSAIFK